MFTYNQYCPVAKSAEVLGDRWTLLLIRDMLFGACHFNEFHRNLPGISRSVLTDRLRRLEDMEVVERRSGENPRAVEYHLTDVGQELREVLMSIGSWGARWFISDPTPKEADPDLVMLWNSTHVDETALPDDRTVVEFEVKASRRKHRYWLVLVPGDVSLCKQYPGFDTDLYVRTDAVTLYKIYMGRTTWPRAAQDRLVDLDGSRSLQKGLAKWLAGSGFSSIVRARKDLD